MKSNYLFLIFILCCVKSSYEYGMYGSELDYHSISGTHFEYKLYLKSLSFEDAKKTCENDNATLFFPENEYEAKAVVAVYNYIVPDGHEFVGSILGLKRSGNSFISINTGAPTQFDVWKSGGPQFDKGACVFLRRQEKFDAYLENIPCYEQRPFICQKPYLIYDPAKMNMPEPEEEDTISNERGGTNYPYIPGTHYYYKLHKKRTTFENAKKVCEAEQATVFYPETEYEAKVVGAFWERSPSYFPQGSFAGFKRSGSDFKSIDTGTSIEKFFLNWKAGEPNNADGVEDCVGLSYAADTMWMNDIPCDSKQSFICKVPITTSFPTTAESSIAIDDDKYHYIPGTHYFYKFYYNEATFDVAKQTCKSENASLFYPQDDREAKTVVSFWKTNRNGGMPQDTVLGIKRDGNDFKSTETNISISILFNTWKAGEPNNAYGAENCVSMTHSVDDIFLKDVSCYKKAVFICKTPFNVININQTPDVLKAYHSIKGTKYAYKLHKLAVSFFAAKETCTKENSTLFYAESEQEAKAVMRFWKTLPNGETPNGIILGLQRTREDFQAIDTGKSIKYYFHHWGRGEPNNANNVESCVAMTQTDDGTCWINDIPCSSEAFFICRKRFSGEEPSNELDDSNIYHTVKGTKYTYKFYDTPTVFNTANETCYNDSASLFYAESKEEANAVMADVIRLRNGNAPDQLILGLRRVGRDFVSIDTEISVYEMFHNWAPGEPNYANNNEDCVSMMYRDGKVLMNDVKCWTTEAPFVCRSNNGPNPNNNNGFHPITGTGHSYKFHILPLIFDSANATCNKENADLFYPKTEQEVKAVLAYWTNLRHGNTPTGLILGLRRAGNDFESIDTHTSVTKLFHKWAAGEPNNVHHSEDCVSLLYKDGNVLMNDVNCWDAVGPYICRSREVSLPMVNDEPNDEPNNEQTTVRNADENVGYYPIKGTDHAYKLYTTPTAFNTANVTCNNENADLFYAKDQEEAYNVMLFWRTIPDGPMPDGQVPNGVILGLRRVGDDFVSIDTRTSVSKLFHNWAAGEPNNANRNEDCVSMAYKHRKMVMNDVNCWNTEGPFICRSRNTVRTDDEKDEFHAIKGTKYFYKLHVNHAQFFSADDTCSKENARLFYAEDEQEANAVLSYWQRFRNREIPSGLVVGLRLKDNDFVSADNYTSISQLYENWAPGEPNKGNDHCVTMSYIDGKAVMKDVKCWELEGPFICKSWEKSNLTNVDVSTENTESCNVPNKDYGYTEFNRKFYKLHSTPETWDDARKKCQDEGTDLAVLNSDEEAAFVVTLLNTRLKTRIPGRFLRRAILLGFQLNDDDKWETVEGHWLSESGYYNWSPGQPDGGQHAFCGAMFFNGELNDVGCNKKALFLCESLSCS